MIGWQPQIFCGGLIDEGQSPRRAGVPSLNWKSVEGCLKIRLNWWQCLISRWRGYGGKEPHFSAIGSHMPSADNVYRVSSLRCLASEKEMRTVRLMMSLRCLP